jgi:hypothetical protein
MKNAPDPYFYSRLPTENAPCSALIGPFASESAARQHLMSEVKATCEAGPDLHLPFGPYQIFRHVATVKPLVRYNVSLTTHA